MDINPASRIDHNETIAQLRSLKTGESMVYHLGHLARNREPGPNAPPDLKARGAEVHLTASTAWMGHVSGRLVLTQRKHPTGYEYIAIARR